MKQLYLFAALLFFQTVVSGQIDLVTDIAPGSEDAGIRNAFSAGGLLFFEADDGVNSDQLWISDGTAEGTFMVLINQDTADNSPNADPQNFILYSDLVYFNADNGDGSQNDKELWVTDGTAEGTMMVANLAADTIEPEGSNPQEFFVFNGNLYFQARVDNSTELWRYDGANVEQATTIGEPGAFATVRAPYVDEENGRVWVAAQSTNGNFEPYIFNGDSARLVKEINPDRSSYGGNGILYNGNFIFEADDEVNGDELWFSDGTEDGTVMILDINSGPDNSDPDDFVIYNGEVYFKAEVDADASEQLWKTDGTADGTGVVAAPNPAGDGEVANLFVFGDLLFFAANDGQSGVELWVYDGTEARLLKDLNPEGDSDPENFIALEGKVYFGADGDNDGDPELWMTDGTADSTVLASTAFDTTMNPIDVDNFVVSDGKLYFTGVDTMQNVGDELYVLTPQQLSTSNARIEVAAFDVYPNPSRNGTFFIQGEDLDQANYRVIDQFGRITARGIINGNRIQLNQPTGSYYLWIEKAQRAFVKKVMMVR